MINIFQILLTWQFVVLITSIIFIILICTIIMLRTLQRSYFRHMSTQSSTETQQPSTRGEYLFFPTNFPIPPYYFYSTKINRFLYDYLLKNKIRHVAAFPIRPGVYRRPYLPVSLENLEQEMGLKGIQWPDRSARPNETMSITHNNVLYDGPLGGSEEAPVKLVPSLDQLYPVGSVCSLNLNTDGSNHILFLRAEIRLEAEWAVPTDSSCISMVGGRTLKVEPLTQMTKDYEQLLSLYERIRAISTVNLPDIDVKNEKALVKVIQLMTGYLCTLSYFSQDRLYTLFKTAALQDRIPLLLRCYREYLNELEQQWKGLSSQGAPEVREKEAVYTIYEQMKRLVGNPGEQKFVDKIRLKLKERIYPEQVRKLIQAELLAIQTQGSHDLSRKKHYINLLTQYPFGILAKQEFDIIKARKILEEDHYGMDKLKRRILQFIAVSKLKGEFKSKVLLLYGPPGVGKTSIVKSIAQCLGRPYARVSLGGEYDTAVVKGHRRTYIGAYPGKIWDSIYRSKAENPVILLDEIDKIVSRAGGASLQDAVMQILDPVQNYRFKDDFMDVQIDLTRVLFICTANSLDTIFPPLLDRLERIEVAGYTTLEKQQIFKKYIVEQAKQQNGLTGEVAAQIQFTPQGVKSLIEGYCKEAGVRNLVRKTNKIFQKIALKYVRGLEYSKSILPEHLRQFLGLPVFHEARLFGSSPPVGVMIGLAYNNFGGSIMYIQCVNQGKKAQSIGSSGIIGSGQQKESVGSLVVTGNIHDVMKESVQLAYTYAKYICSTFFHNNYLEQNDVHINFPQIQIGKDGPSAGIAITSAFISLAMNTPIQKEIAMTGEITLSGRVNPIGGVKEKTMGARREGIKILIFPEDNKKDVDELQPEIKEGMSFYFANHYFQVLELVLGLKAEPGLKPLPGLSV